MEIKTVKTGRMLNNGQIVFDATVSLAESGTFDTMEERDIWVAEKTEYLNGLKPATSEKVMVKGRPSKKASKGKKL